MKREAKEPTIKALKLPENRKQRIARSDISNVASAYLPNLYFLIKTMKLHDTIKPNSNNSILVILYIDVARIFLF